MRILLVDDHEIIRRGIRALLASGRNHEICGEAVDGLDAVQKAKELNPDLIIMDVSMPRLNGLEATREIRSMMPTCEVVILTQHDSPQMIEKAFEAGARGYVVKTSIARDLLKAIAKVGHHNSFVDPAIAAREKLSRMDLAELLQRAEARQGELRESESRFRAVADTAPVLIWMSGVDTLCNFFNKPWLDFRGRTLQQEIGNGWAEGLHPEDLDRCIDTYLSSFKARNPFSMEYRLRRADGAYRWVLDQGVARYLPDGQFAGYIGSCMDITERKNVEDMLLATQAELERNITDRTIQLEERRAQVAQQDKLLELVNDAIFIRSVEQKISYWNQGAERLYEWTSEEALGRPVQELLHTEFPIPLAEILTKDHWDGELKERKRDGTQIMVASRWAALRDDKGETTGWLQINSDITARKVAEDTARSLSGRLLRLQDEERRRIARELHDSAGQYLAAIHMALDSIRENAGVLPVAVARKAEEAASLTEACATEIRTMSHLLHPPLLEELGLASAVRWYVDEFGARSGIHAQLEIPATLSRLGSDAELVLFRVLQESLTNVHRHSGSKTAQVRIGVDAHQAWIEVQDQGNGQSASDPLRPGMGIAGMRERIKTLAGALNITSSQTGTLVKAVIPLAGDTPNGQKGRPKMAKREITSSTKTKTPKDFATR